MSDELRTDQIRQDEPQDTPGTTTAGEGTDAGLRERLRLNRRRFLATTAATGVAAGAVTLPRAIAQDGTPAAGTPTNESSTAEGHDHTAPAPAEDAAKGGLTFFVPFQAAIVEAAAARLIPSDDLGPGATEAGVVYFIDRQLAQEHHYHGFRGPRYALGPFLDGEPTQGDQSALPMRDRFRLGIFGMEAYAQELYGSGFAQLSPEQQDQILTDMEAGVPETFDGASLQSSPVMAGSSGTEAIQKAGQAGVGAKAFFDLLLGFTIAGFFADPVQGGNRDMVGWKMIGFPGAHIGYAGDILEYGKPFEGDYISLAQYQQQITGGA